MARRACFGNGAIPRAVAVPLAALVVAVAAAPALGAAEAAPPLHPPVRLLDGAGESVTRSGRPVSPGRTCAFCHDVDYIQSHSYHACAGLPERAAPGELPRGRPWDTSPGLFGRWSPLTYRLLTPLGEAPLDLGTADWIRTAGARHVGGGPGVRSRRGADLLDLEPEGPGDPETSVLDPETGAGAAWDWKASGTSELDCFLCHVASPAVDERRRALEAGRFAEAPTATLARTGLVERAPDGWRWRPESFEPDGTTSAATLGIASPRSSHCGACHGLVEEGREPILWQPGLAAFSTETKGQVFSGQRISDSALNLVGKAGLSRPWDVHAERLLACSSCHHSLNQPAYRHETELTRPAHLTFDARKLAISEYLVRPSHQLARGESAQGPFAAALRGTMRDCGDCHDYEASHRWLPYRGLHREALRCESCHVSRVVAPARRQTDWTLLTAEGEPLVEHRGVEGDAPGPASVIRGWDPVLLSRRDLAGDVRLAPHNLIASWFWLDGDPPRPVRLHDLKRALLGPSGHRPEVVAALDADRDGRLARRELRLDSPEKVEAIRKLLVGAGARDPRIEGEIQPFTLSHGVAEGRWSVRECGECHSRSSRVARTFEVASYVPGGVLPTLVGDSNVTLAARDLARRGDALVFRLEPAGSGLHILGHDRSGWIDGLGLAAVLGTLLGALVHAGGRVLVHVRSRRRR